MSNRPRRPFHVRASVVPPLAAWEPLDRCRCERCDDLAVAVELGRLRDEVESVGYGVTAVVGAAPFSSWSHTVGLSSRLSGPELVVWGLNEDLAERLLTAAVEGFGGVVPPVRDRAVRHEFGAGAVAPGRTFCLVEVDERLVDGTRLLRTAHDLDWLVTPVRGAVQLVVSDRFGQMPWHHEYDGPAQCHLDDIAVAERWFSVCRSF